MPAKKKVSKKSRVKKSPAGKKAVPAKSTKPARPKQKQPPAPKTKREFPIVGIGTSAGGLDALIDFFSNMPLDNNMAFIVIQHLDPMRKSNMSSILQKYTKMKVLEIEDGVSIMPNRVYLNPPHRDVAVMNKTLQLMEPHYNGGAKLSIDAFFRSLAEELGENSICLIFSGSGSDGSLGLKSVRDKGGLVMVQQPEQAKYDGMPRSAINTGMVDRVMPVEKMPAELIQYTTHPYVKNGREPSSPDEEFNTQLQKIFVLIRSKTGHDFSHYKHTTLKRRIERRLALHQLDRLADYVTYLQQTPREVDILFKDILITVTHFFRDSAAYNALAKKVLPKLLAKKKSSLPVRVWVPGCATGEEAYSLAIAFQEAMDKMKNPVEIKIFATDINEDVINYARQGNYPGSIATDVSAKRLKRFFLKEDDTYQIKKFIREMIVFATQSIIKDPPFSKLDLIVCRNLLIYLNKELQEKVLPLFHYTLNPGGFLFLGTSEGIGSVSNLFEPVDVKNKIFRSKIGVITKPIEYLESAAKGDTAVITQGVEHSLVEADIHNLADKMILEHYALPCVLINRDFDILYFHGKTGKYLSPPAGGASFNILKMVNEDLHQALSTILHQSVKRKEEIVKRGIEITYNQKSLTVDLAVRPIIENKTGQHLMMVVFDDKTHFEESAKKSERRYRKDTTESRIDTLEQELQSAREYLQTTVEELETTNEELKSANEELQSTNEELQSTNEELSTVNAELQNKIEELSRANDDLNNLFSSTEIGTIFLDEDLCIKRFSPRATKLFNLIKSDIGRPISDITFNIDFEHFFGEIKEVFEKLEHKEFEVTTHDNKVFVLRILPYRTQKNVIEGIVITFTDVTTIKDILSLQRLAAVVTDSNDAITLLNHHGSITAWNRGAEKMYGYTEAEALKMKISDLLPEHRKGEFIEMIKVLKANKEVKPFQTKRIVKEGGTIDVFVNVTKLLDDDGSITHLATTERKLSDIENILTIRKKDKKKPKKGGRNPGNS
jgi:two-component system CheB/CheR fusion protein